MRWQNLVSHHEVARVTHDDRLSDLSDKDELYPVMSFDVT